MRTYLLLLLLTASASVNVDVYAHVHNLNLYSVARFAYYSEKILRQKISLENPVENAKSEVISKMLPVNVLLTRLEVRVLDAAELTLIPTASGSTPALTSSSG